jgi:hypothetical protein
MRLFPFSLIMAACLYLLTSCDKNDADPNIPVMDMSTDFVLNKSDREVEVLLDMSVPGGIKSLEISKGVNLQPDAAYGVKTVTPAPAGDNKFRYMFYYTLQRAEVDKLVGFNFKLTDNAGRVVEKDLTVHTEANAAEIIYSRKWKLVSKLRITDGANEETIENCDKDNKFTFRKDSTMMIDWGSPGCGLEGLNVYDKWELSEDEKNFKQEYYDVFNPARRTVEAYSVRSISSTKLEMLIIHDMSWLPPLTDKEEYIYTWEPTL